MSPREAEYEEKGAVILAVNALEDPAAGKAWIEECGLDMQWVFADAAVTEAFGVSAVPSQVLVGKDGTVVWTSSFSSLMGGAEAILAQVDAAL